MNDKICSMVDHTLLSQTSVWEEIKRVCEEAIEYKTASVCIPPAYVKQVKELFGDKLKICTVIGFPNGYSTTKVKVFETADAILNGTDEIDMVINIGWLKDKKYENILEEIREIKQKCGKNILKVIIETCLLTDDEKIKMCEIITESGADYIKTSTGFSKGGATFEDIKLFLNYIGDNVKIKAAGGINSLEDAEKFIDLGVSRLGSSKVVKLIKERF